MKIKRKPRPVKNYRYQVSLDKETVKQAQKLGNGNLSLGLRMAVTNYGYGRV